MSRPPAAGRRWAGTGLLALAGLILIGALIWRLIPGSFGTQGLTSGLRFTATPAGAPVEAAGPLRVDVDLDLQALRGKGQAVIPYVDVQLLDRAGHPALFAGVPGTARPMHITGLGNGWTAQLSAPSVAGTYHAHLLIRVGDAPAGDVDLPQPEVTVVPAVPYAGGFVYSRNGNLWRTTVNGAHVHELTFYTGDGRADFPAWAPDGGRIAFARALPAGASQIPNTELWAIDPDGSGARQLVARRPEEDLSLPAYAPGGALYFTSDRTLDPSTGATPTMDRLTAGVESWSIDRLAAPGAPRRPVVPAARMADISRDGKTMVYLGAADAPAESERPVTHTLLLAGADGQAPRVLVGSDTFQDIYAPHLSPDGQQVVFAAVNPTGVPDGQTLLQRLGLAPLAALANGVPWDLYMVPAAGGPVRRLTHVNADLPFPAWSRDGRRLAWLDEKGLSILDLGHPTDPPQQIGPGSSHGQLAWY